MAITVSNIGSDWFVKFFRETWFFGDIEEFVPVLAFLLGHRINFFVKVEAVGFSVSMQDVSLSPVSFDVLNDALTLVLGYKRKFGDKVRGGVTSVPNPNTRRDMCHGFGIGE
jgi:hypothetical protein